MLTPGTHPSTWGLPHTCPQGSPPHWSEGNRPPWKGPAHRSTQGSPFWPASQRTQFLEPWLPRTSAGLRALELGLGLGDLKASLGPPALHSGCWIRPYSAKSPEGPQGTPVGSWPSRDSRALGAAVGPPWDPPVRVQIVYALGHQGQSTSASGSLPPVATPGSAHSWAGLLAGLGAAELPGWGTCRRRTRWEPVAAEGPCSTHNRHPSAGPAGPSRKTSR